MKKIIVTNTSHILIIIIFIITFIFGKNLGLMPQDSAFQNEITTLKKSINKRYDVLPDQKILKISDVINISPNFPYRILLDLYKENKQVINDTDNRDQFTIFLTNELGEEQKLKEFNLKDGEIQNNSEINFTATGHFQNLEVRRPEKLDSAGILTVQNIRLYALNDIDNLKPTISGYANDQKIILDNLTEKSNKTRRFNRKRQVIGISFIANANNISSVDIGLIFIGSGGVNSYNLELYEADDKGVPDLSRGRLAHAVFSKESSKDSMVGPNIYHIPLGANLNIGSNYFLGINNSEVKFNILNTLKILSSDKSQKEEFDSWSIVDGRSIKLSSDHLDIRIKSNNQVKFQEEKILTGAIIQDLGAGKGHYQYKQRSEPSDFLDIFNIHNEKDQQCVFFDPVAIGISAKAIGDVSFTYKFNTIYPFNKLAMNFQSHGGSFSDIVAYYSYDNDSWQEVSSDLSKELRNKDKNNYFEVLDGNNNRNLVYLKIVYDHNNKYKLGFNHLFGIRYLKVEADLNIR